MYRVASHGVPAWFRWAWIAATTLISSAVVLPSAFIAPEIFLLPWVAMPAMALTGALIGAVEAWLLGWWQQKYGISLLTPADLRLWVLLAALGGLLIGMAAFMGEPQSLLYAPLVFALGQSKLLQERLWGRAVLRATLAAGAWLFGVIFVSAMSQLNGPSSTGDIVLLVSAWPVTAFIYSGMIARSMARLLDDRALLAAQG